jgi:predicted lipid carrier protein YhbT
MAAIARWISHRVGAARRERLERLLRGPRRLRMVLGVIFRAMPRLVRRSALERERSVIEFRIVRADNRHEVRQLVIEDGAAVVLHGEEREPDLRLTIGAVEFLLLATGNASGAAMFVRGDVELDGDPWLALRLPRLFATGPR